MKRGILSCVFLLLLACSSNKNEPLNCITSLDCPDGYTCEASECVTLPDKTVTADKDTAVTDEMGDELFDDEIEKEEKDINDERDHDIADIVVVDEDAVEGGDDAIENSDDATVIDEDTIETDDTLLVEEDTAEPDDATLVDEDVIDVDSFVPDVDTLVDECTVNDNPCNDHGDTTATCTDEVGGYTCNCTFGFDPTLGGCHDIDECAAGTDTCAANAACANTTGGFTCTCDSYYSGTGEVCTFCAADGLCGATCTACDGATPHCKDNGNGTTQCVLCTEEGHCGGGTPHCLLTQNICVTCRDRGDCGALDVCLSASRTCSPNVCGDGEILRPSGATLWLPFNEGSGGAAYDRSGNGNNGTVNGAAWTDGRFGKGLQFSGGETISLSESATLKTGTQMTVAAWIKGSTIPGSYVTIIQKDGASVRNYGLFITGSDQPADQGKILFSLSSATPGEWHGPVSDISVIDGAWHQVAGIYDGSCMRIYDDGVERGSSAVSIVPADTGNGVSIGGGFVGVIDEVRLYQRALGTAELAELANRRVLLPIDEGTGGTAYDLSGNGDHGTFNGAPVWTVGRFSGGLSFDGVDDTVAWTYAGGAPINNFTMMAWVQATTTHEIDAESSSTTAGTTGQTYLFGADHRQDDAGAGVSVGTNGISVYEHGSGYMPPLAVYSAEIGTGWNHIAVTYTDRQPRIYLNGVLVREGLFSARATVYAPTRFGGGPYGFFAGQGDEVRIYDRPLTEAEISAIAQNTYPGELCDDGNRIDGDGCSAACISETLP